MGTDLCRQNNIYYLWKILKVTEVISIMFIVQSYLHIAIFMRSYLVKSAGGSLL